MSTHRVGEEWVDPVFGPVRRISKPTPWQLPRGNSLMKEASMSDATHHFFVLGSQYYVAGRYAAFAALNPIVGNLLHHAVEMLIKGALSKSNSLDDLRRIGHKLPNLWDAFKQRANDVSLARFDAVIDRLDSFEEVR